MKTMSVEQFRKKFTKKPKNKYHVAPKTDRTFEGIVFDSKREMNAYKNLLMERVPGRVILRQVPFRLPGGIKYVADFVTLEPHDLCTLVSGREPLGGGHMATLIRRDEVAYAVRVIDAKGFKTPEYKLKKKLFEASFPWKIEEV